MVENKLKQKVRDIMFLNIEAGYSKLLKTSYNYIKPSHETYPFQWWWDTFFHVFILCSLNQYELAKQNILSLFAQQEENGFVGHMIYWRRIIPKNITNVTQARPSLEQFRPHMSSLIQPTFAAQVVEKIYNGDKDKNFLDKILPKIKKYHEWLKTNRDFEKNGLISIITPFESGIDWKPSYDCVVDFKTRPANWKLLLKVMEVDFFNFFHRYNLKKIYEKDKFIVKDVLVNTVYAMDLKALTRLCRLAEDSDSKKYEDWAKQTAQKIVELMYDKKDAAFYDLYSHELKKSKALTFTIFAPMVLEEVPKDLSREIIKRHLLNKKEFNLKYPIPSAAKKEPSFETKHSQFLWRGPTWVFINWFLYRCLKAKGFEVYAEKVLQSTKRLIQKSGFREYYDPFTGEGYGAVNFTWSGLVLDMLDKK